MKLKLLITSMFVLAGALFAVTPASAFSGSDCKKGTMYYDYHYTGALDASNKPIETTDDQKSKLTKPKESTEIKTIADCNLPASSTDYELVDRGTVIINTIVGVVGIIAVAVIVIGGVFYTTSAGDPAKAKRGQTAILYGIVGLIVSLLAFAIVNFVLKNVF